MVFVASRMAFLGLPLGAAYAVSKRGLTAYADCVRAEYGTHVKVASVHPAMVRTQIHDSTVAAGLSLEGVSTAESLEGVRDRIVAACLDPRPRRDAAVSRAGRAQLFAARHLPSSSTAWWPARWRSGSARAPSTRPSWPRGCASATGADPGLVLLDRFEHEDLDGEVGVDVVLAHEGHHLAFELAFHDRDEVVAHRHLEVVA